MAPTGTVEVQQTRGDHGREFLSVVFPTNWSAKLDSVASQFKEQFRETVRSCAIISNPPTLILGLPFQMATEVKQLANRFAKNHR